MERKFKEIVERNQEGEPQVFEIETEGDEVKYIHENETIFCTCGKQFECIKDIDLIKCPFCKAEFFDEGKFKKDEQGKLIKK